MAGQATSDAAGSGQLVADEQLASCAADTRGRRAGNARIYSHKTGSSPRPLV